MLVFVDLTCDLTRSALGEAMSKLALTYSVLGRHQDALVLEEKALEFQRRVLPENHPLIGSSCLNISKSYCLVDDFHRAIERAREALRIFQAALPPSHPHVKMAQELVRRLEGSIARRAGDEVGTMDKNATLARILSDQGRHDEAVVIYEAVLKYRRRVLPENHPDIGVT